MPSKFSINKLLQNSHVASLWYFLYQMIPQNLFLTVIEFIQHLNLELKENDLFIIPLKNHGCMQMIYFVFNYYI